jgi:hypothetical protein
MDFNKLFPFTQEASLLCTYVRRITKVAGRMSIGVCETVQLVQT